MENSSFAFSSFLKFFWLVESVDVESVGMEGQLQFFQHFYKSESISKLKVKNTSRKTSTHNPTKDAGQ